MSNINYSYDLSFLDTEKTPKTFADKYFGGFAQIFPEEKVPKIFREGYNRSIEGLAYQAIRGKPYYDLGGWTPGMLADIASTIMSFVASPSDIATMGIGGAVGKAVISPLMSGTAKKLVKSGFSQELARKAVQEGGEQLVAKLPKTSLDAVITSQAPELAKRLGANIGSLGFYSGLQSAAVQQIEDKDIDAVQVLYDSAKGALTGFASSAGSLALAPVVAKRLNSKSNLVQLMATKGIEVGAFGSSPALFETLEGNPRLPHPGEYAHAAGVIAGLQLGRNAFGKVTRVVKQETLVKPAEKQFKLEREIAKAEKRKDPLVAEAEELLGIRVPDVTKEQRFKKERLDDGKTKIRILDKNWLNKTGDSMIEFEFIQSKIPRVQAEINQAKGQNLSKTGKLSKTELLEKYPNSNLDPSFKGLTTTASNIKLAETIAKKLNMPKEEFNLIRAINFDKNELSISNTRRFRIAMQDKLKLQADLKKLSTDPLFEKSVAFARHSSPLKTYMPKKLYDIFVKSLTPAELRVSHPLKNYSFELVEKYSLENVRTLNSFLNKNIGILGKAGFNDAIAGGKKGKAELNAVRDFLKGEGKFSIINGAPNTGSLNIKRGDTFTIADGTKFQFKIIDPKNYRLAFNQMFTEAKRAGIKTAQFEPNYVPEPLKLEVIDLIRLNVGNMSKRLQKDPQVFGELLNNQKPNKQQAIAANQFINDYLKEIGVNNQFSQILNQIRKKLEQPSREQLLTRDTKKIDKNVSTLEALKLLQREVYKELNVTNHSLESKRTFVNLLSKELKDQVIEKDMGKLTLRYFSKGSRSIAHAKHLGIKGSKAMGITEHLSKIGKVEDARIINQIYESATGAIEYNPKFNWSVKTKSFLKDLTDFQVATKIGLGFATIPNISQITISAALKVGYGPLISGVRKWNTDPEYKKLVESVTPSGYGDLLAVTLGTQQDAIIKKFSPAWFAQKTTDRFFGIVPGFSFNKINELNFKMSTVAAYENLLKLQRTATGKNLQSKNANLRAKATMELRKAGFEKPDVILDLKNKNMKASDYDKIQQYAYTFARDYQLQKSVLRDPLIVNDPRFRPFFLFKRFGIRQYDLYKRILSEEGINPFLYLRLAAGGLAGAAVIQPAKEMLGELLAGKNIYDENFSLKYEIPFFREGEKGGQLKDIGPKEILDSFAVVGTAGVVTDILAAEDPLRAVEFTLTPVIWQDLNKIYDTATRAYKESKDYGIYGAIRRTPKNLSPIFGTGPRRALQRAWTQKQREDFTTYRKGPTRTRILDAFLDGNYPKGEEIMREWNRVYGYENPIVWSDVDYDDLTKRYITKLEKRRRP
tara:strand:- start:25 stop:3993 length:3969 start_codon:yes stop_codon:yes gene_type:complete